MISRRSLAFDSVVRILTESAVLGFGLISGIVLARSLGPADKGVLSALTFLFGLIGQSSALGLEEASILLVGRRRASVRRALGATLPVVLLASLVGAALLWSLADLLFDFDKGRLGSVVGASLLAVPLIATNFLFTGMLNAQRRIAYTSVARLVARAITLAALLIFVLQEPLTLTRGVAAEISGAAVGALLLGWRLVSVGVPPLPRLDLSFLREALPRGLPIQAARIFANLSGRLDLLFVLTLAGRAPAGQYSVALTIGQLVTHVALALTFASFPRLASIESEDEAWQLAVRVFRFGIVSAVATAIPVAVAVPVAVPGLFGPGFSPAVVPSLLLLIGGVFWSGQLILTRVFAARGQPSIMFRSYGVGLAVMMALDIVLIPSLGATGAAVASIAAPLSGLMVCISAYRQGQIAFSLKEFLPRRADVVELMHVPKRVLRRRPRP